MATTTNITNNGWATTYPTITLTGPITNPTLGNVTTGEYLLLSGTFANTDTLVVDLYNKLITLNGVSARNLLSTGTWFAAPAGTSQYYLTGSLTTSGFKRNKSFFFMLKLAAITLIVSPFLTLY